MNKKITFLGPVGATFSHDAYNILSNIYGTPSVIADGIHANCVPAQTNGEILTLIAQHGGYGAIAMETLAEGRVAEPLESFIDLLKRYERSSDDCPFHVIGAVRLKIHFCFMKRKGCSVAPHGVIAHPKSLGACRKRVAALDVATREVSSNGEAARLVASDFNYAYWAALGPRSAAEKYDLDVLNGAFEDKEAVTTFFLIGPKSHEVRLGERNRTLIVFSTAHRPGALVDALYPFAKHGFNLIQVHSVHAGGGVYDFAIEIESRQGDARCLSFALEKFKQNVGRSIVFGPFSVISK